MRNALEALLVILVFLVVMCAAYGGLRYLVYDTGHPSHLSHPVVVL